MKSTVTVSTKGQVVIPADIREAMGLVAGTRISVERLDDRIVLRPITREFIRSFRGYFRGSKFEEFRERAHRDDKRRP